jgi:Cu/Ag efflux protein CusF
MHFKAAAVLTVMLCASVAATASDQQAITKGKTSSVSATVIAIDSTARTITLRDSSGLEDTYSVGPEVQRFNEIKVGDTVKTTYYESTVAQIRKPGSTPAAAGTSGTVTPGTGALPSGTMALQDKMTVTVKSIDTDAPSITVTTADGRTVTRRVEDKKNLEGVKAGDQIDITTTKAVLISIERAQ